jgi:tetratricopeptide (TPR) repeat protein
LMDCIGPTGRPAPYVELMAGVYTDNQPDFTYLLPYETKTFSQFWWPYKKIGPVQNANEEAAVRLVVNDDKTLDLGAVVSRAFDGARIVLCDGDTVLIDERIDISPKTPWQNKELTFAGDDACTLEMAMRDAQDNLLVSYRPVNAAELEQHREKATEPPLPEEIEFIDELYFTAEHLEQYRHPTRYPEMYWDEILTRDPLDARTNIAYGRRRFNQGMLDAAAAFFEQAIKRLTRRHPNPCTGEAHYYLGLVRRFQGCLSEAYAALYKATWSYEWRAAAYYELAMLDCRKGDFMTAITHCEASLDTNRQNNKAFVLQVLAMKKLGQDGGSVLNALLKTDPLDHWARHASGDTAGFLDKSRNDAQTVLDIAYDYADAGFAEEAIGLLELHHANEVKDVSVPNPLAVSQLTHYALAWLKKDTMLLEQARALHPDYMFPSRLHDQLVLEWALAQPGTDGNAAYGLGNLYFDKKRHEEAIAVWEKVPPFATVCRNLGIAYWNVRNDGEAARAAYKKALELDPSDARLFAEYDQLRAKLGDAAEDRLATLLSRTDLVSERDDCSVALAELYNETDQPEAALEYLLSRRFHPWEGGEGKVLKQYTTARLLLGQRALEAGDASAALKQFEQAMRPPENLGEAYHLLQAKADVSYWTGKALRTLGREEEAIAQFESSANEAGDFQAMAVTEHSELSYFRGLSLIELDRGNEAKSLFEDLLAFAGRELETQAKIDYFATSLPLLLVFEENLDELKKRNAQHLSALAEQGLEQVEQQRKRMNSSETKAVR